MQRYRHYGASLPPVPAPAPVEEIHAEEEEEEEEEVYDEEEVYREEAEPLIQEEAEPVVQETGSANEEEASHTKEEVQPVDQETEGKTTPTESKNGKKSERGGGGGGDDAPGGGPKYSMFTWFVVLALLGVWSSVAVVYFDIVDYDSVVARAQEFRVNFSQVLQGKLTAYDTDGDGDFDVEDAKVLLGLTKDGGGSVNAESLEEVLNILAEEGSDWIYGFFTFLYDVVASPVEKGKEAAAEMKEEEEEGGTTTSDEVKGVTPDLQNQ